MISARLTFEGKDTDALGLAIGPDNLPEMIMKAEGEHLSFEFSVQKIGTMLATIDDLLMNLKIAEETLVCGE
ncbi:Uncharacterised protein [uncultured archaeon]|nr:Uncharacterised protein [uncultured archaeon]